MNLSSFPSEMLLVPSFDLVIWKLGGRDGQYSIKDHGLPEPESLPNVEQPVTVRLQYQGDVYVKTLDMVI